jgi:acyl dehydratase
MRQVERVRSEPNRCYGFGGGNSSSTSMPVRIGKRIRSKQTVLEVSEKKPGQWLMKTAVTVEIEGENTPALIAEILSMMVVA